MDRVRNAFVQGGIMSGGAFVQGHLVGFCPGGFCPTLVFLRYHINFLEAKCETTTV